MSEDIAIAIDKYMIEGNVSSALDFINSDKNKIQIRENPWKILPTVTKHLNETVNKKDPQFFDSCIGVLNSLVRIIQPDDVLLMIIEDVQAAKDDLMFITLLETLLKVILELLPAKRVNYLAWCLNSIGIYVGELPRPDNLNLEGGDKLLMDADGYVLRISALYYELLPFYERVVDEILKLNFREYNLLAMKFLLQLLGEPIACLDMSCEIKSKSKARLVAEKLMLHILHLCGDAYQFLDSSFNSETDDIKVNNLARGVFFYLLLGEQVYLECAPKVYNPVYVFQNCLKYVIQLLAHDNQFVLEKGLGLSKALLHLVSGSKLSYLLLDSEVHCMFCKTLANIMIYSPVEAYRKSSLQIFHLYLYQFDVRGRYLISYNIISSINYVALNSYVITQYKEMMVEELDKNKIVSEYFIGNKLLNLLNICCKLPEGTESDLTKSADQIIASLNLLRYLAIRDKKNVTKIWNHFRILRNSYLEPLQKGLMLSKAHYNLKVKEVLTENAHGDKGENESRVSVTIGGHNLPELSTKEKVQVLNSSLTAFDVMESLLCRLNEFMENCPPDSVGV